jgi:hypothetical protein
LEEYPLKYPNIHVLNLSRFHKSMINIFLLIYLLFISMIITFFSLTLIFIFHFHIYSMLFPLSYKIINRHQLSYFIIIIQYDFFAGFFLLSKLPYFLIDPFYFITHFLVLNNSLLNSTIIFFVIFHFMLLYKFIKINTLKY